LIKLYFWATPECRNNSSNPTVISIRLFIL